MDYQLYGIVALVVVVSLVSLFFIKKSRDGKSFEDVLAEKRQLAHLVGGSKYNKKPQRKVNNNNNKKDKKERRQKERKEEQEVEESQNDSDAGSESHSASSNSPTHSKGHVEFSEAEIIAEETVSVAQSKKNQKKNQNRKNSATKPILINKTETLVGNVAATVIAETVNHFEQILPKDDVEIKKHRDEIQSKKKNQPKTKGSPKIETPQLNSVPVPVVETFAVAEKINNVAAEKGSPKNAPNKDKLNKKKKNDNAAVQQFNHNHLDLANGGDVNVNGVLQLLGRADLARSEFQIIIDFLLNKQQDTLVDHSNWSDDPLQKLKKQLLEREQALADEQEASAGLHVKLREMRVQINNLTAQNKSYEVAHQKQQEERNTELQLLTNEFKVIKDRLEQDNVRLDQGIKHLQEELFKKQQAASAEGVQKLQQLTETNAALGQEVQRLQQALAQLQTESAAKLKDAEQLYMQTEAKVMLANSTKDKELSDMYANLEQQLTQAKQLDDQSKVEIRNLQNALDSSAREVTVLAEEANKWRQLYNDLSKSGEQNRSQEVEKLIATVVEVKAQLADKDNTLTQSQVQLKAKDETIAQLNDQLIQCNVQNSIAAKDLSTKATEAQSRLVQEKAKVNELSSVLADKEAELHRFYKRSQEQEDRLSDLQSEIDQCKEKNNQAQQVIDQQPLDRTKQVLERLFPEVVSSTTISNIQSPADYEQWLDHLAAHIEQTKRTTTSNSISVNDHNSSCSQKSQATITNHINHTSNSTQSSASDNDADDDDDSLALENLKLQSEVDHYKSLVVEAGKTLNKLETKVREQEQQLALSNGNAVI